MEISETKPLCFFVIGPESTGSTYMAKILNKHLNGFDWNGRGWNDNEHPLADKTNGFTKPVGDINSVLICHRSLPFSSMYPPTEKWVQLYDCKFIWAVREINCSHNSRKKRWGSRRNWEEESLHSLQYLNAIQQANHPLYYFSYEALVFTKNLYLDNFYDLVDQFKKVENRYYPLDIKDMNQKYFK